MPECLVQQFVIESKLRQNLRSNSYTHEVNNKKTGAAVEGNSPPQCARILGVKTASMCQNDVNDGNVQFKNISTDEKVEESE